MLVYLKPEVIFVDYDMPAMNGPQFIEELKKNEALQGIPVILYSATIHPHNEQDATRLGIARCLQKPASIVGLIRELKSVFATA
jgi:CheY-like chemotaxis protein